MNMCETDKQSIHVILRDSVRYKRKALDHMEVPSVGCITHTLQLAAITVQCQRLTC